MICRFLPQGIDLSPYTDRSLNDLEFGMNNMPRQILNFTTPPASFSRLKLNAVTGITSSLHRTTMNPQHLSFQTLAAIAPEDFWAATNATASQIGWKALMTSAFSLLRDSNAKELWPTAIEVITCGGDHTDALPGDVNECIARIHYCVGQIDELDTVEMEEQIWMFVSKWLKLPYTSDWSPYSDPDVSNRMARMRGEA